MVTPLDSIHVARAFSSAVTKRDHGSVHAGECGAFKIVKDGKEPIYLKAATEAEMYMWIKHIIAGSKRGR